LFFTPHNSLYAGRYILNGYKNAISSTGNKFKLITVDTRNSKELLASFNPNIIMLTLNRYNVRFLDEKKILYAKSLGAKVFFNISFWQTPISNRRINESTDLKNDKELLKIISSGLGDVYYNICEQGDSRMVGFEEATGYKHYTIPLAADDTVIYPEYSSKFKADISFIGTYLPEKRPFFEERVFPLKNDYNLRLYGQDWTFTDRMLGWAQRGGQYFNIPYLKSFRKPKLELSDERKIYNSSVISINVHEEYQRKFGGDCNERTFKIPLAGGFEISDDVACLKKYFKEGEEIVIAKDKKDWFEKINYYMKNPEKRNTIIEAGKQRVLKEHTYKNRVEQMIRIYNSIK